MTRTIYTPHHSHFGDIFATIQYMVSLGKPVLLTRWQNGEDLGQLEQDIIDCLDIPPGRITIVDEPGNAAFNAAMIWRVPYVPTKVRWRLGPHRQIAFQFDGKSIASDKNPPPDQLAELMDPAWLPEGVRFTRVGLPLNASQNAEIMAASDCFVGVCSGMAHLAHATGIPTFLIEYRLPLEQAHRGKAYTRCTSAIDAITRVRAELGFPPIHPPVPFVPPAAPMPASQGPRGFGRASDQAKVAPALPRLRKRGP